jgi:hypothetical protein
MSSRFAFSRRRRTAIVSLAFLFAAILPVMAGGEETEPCAAPGCAAPVDAFFTEELWAKIGAVKCLQCHKTGGDAEDSQFLLRDPSREAESVREELMRHNRNMFARMAGLKSEDQPHILLKVVGELDHGGEEVLPADSAEYRILAEFVRRANAPAGSSSESVIDPNLPPFFDGVVMLDDRRLLRRVTLSLAGRLPTDAEFAALAQHGRAALPEILDALMNEDAFYVRLREAFNDVFLTLGVEEGILSYEHFEKTRHWYQKHDLSHIKDENERRRAGYKLADDYRQALKEEPMWLIDSSRRWWGGISPKTRSRQRGSIRTRDS